MSGQEWSVVGTSVSHQTKQVGKASKLSGAVVVQHCLTKSQYSVYMYRYNQNLYTRYPTNRLACIRCWKFKTYSGSRAAFRACAKESL